MASLYVPSSSLPQLSSVSLIYSIHRHCYFSHSQAQLYSPYRSGMTFEGTVCVTSSRRRRHRNILPLRHCAYMWFCPIAIDRLKSSIGWCDAMHTRQIRAGRRCVPDAQFICISSAAIPGPSHNEPLRHAVTMHRTSYITSVWHGMSSESAVSPLKFSNSAS